MSEPVTPPASTMPVVRLLAKANARAIRHGFPWVYANEMVMDRRTKGLTAGTMAQLQDADRQPMGVVTVNPVSKIACRMMDQNPEAVIDQAWLEVRLTRALAHRDVLYDAPYYRLVHAEADGLPGVVIDRFGDLAVIQPNAAWSEMLIDVLADALMVVTGVTTVIKNATGRARQLEGLGEETVILRGAEPTGPVPVPMNGATYMADVMGGQKTGLFFDQRPNHACVAGLSKGQRVLDMFAHVGGFGLAALAAGATEALAVDGSQAALDLATQGAEASGFADAFSTRKDDAFQALTELDLAGERFGVVVCDPPAFAPSKNALEAGLRAYERIARLAAPLVEENGYLVLCSCSHAADLTKFRNASARGIGRGGRRGHLVYTGYAGPDHPVLPHLAESGYLKVLVFRL